MIRRIATAAVLLAIVFSGFIFPGMAWVLVVLTGVIAVACTWEMSSMLQPKGIRVYRRVASWGVLALLVEAVLTQMQFAGLVLGLAICLSWIFRMPGKVEGALGDITATTFTMAYVGLPLAAVVTLFLASPEAEAWLLLTLGIIWVTDSMALIVGSRFGTIKLAPRISPGKTWEGSAGGVLGALLVVLFVRLAFPNAFWMVSDLELVLFAVLFSIIGQVGDLAESLLKRDVGVKDSGSSLTGHGGFLDLMDAVLLAAIPLMIYLHLLHPYVFGGI